jgi:sulfonate transport system ATP-binding protein
MRPFPGRIAAAMPVLLPRPRDRLSTEFEEAKRQVLTALGRSLTEPHPPRGLEQPTGALASF